MLDKDNIALGEVVGKGKVCLSLVCQFFVNPLGAANAKSERKFSRYRE